MFCLSTNEVGERIEIRLRPNDGGTRLEGLIPVWAGLPIELSLKLAPTRPEAFFNFDFPAPSIAAIGETHAAHNH